ncbi:ABC transporter ATP-binding protein [Haloimpatiens lingqiaonensis]|uniref:ABC transporter ATP-binding protein n=1 Tax=Haloimpatiens lingqiaonensis TaxID=1380675 RepID=UPI0010FDABDE|nr:ATP-binding cassette domain-containing protein [Haloimpatiens lingqiaonensis]
MLQIKNLYKVFNKGTVNENVLFNNFNLKVEEGDFISIIGSNGAGKSTLLNIVSGNIDLTEGSIILNGSEISRLPEYKRTKQIGRVFQNPSLGVSPNMTILENMSMAYNKGKKFNFSFAINKNNINMFKETLSKLNIGLENKLHNKVGLLSGGQRQALSLIMAVMAKPKLLLLDEHTAAIDPKTSEIIMDITSDIVEKNKITTLMVTHNLNDAIKMGNRLIMIHKGQVVMDIRGNEKKNLTADKLLDEFKKLENAISDSVLFA